MDWTSVLQENRKIFSERFLLHCALYTSSKKVPSPTFFSPPPKKTQRVKDEGRMAKYQF